MNSPANSRIFHADQLQNPPRPLLKDPQKQDADHEHAERKSEHEHILSDRLATIGALLPQLQLH